MQKARISIEKAMHLATRLSVERYPLVAVDWVDPTSVEGWSEIDEIERDTVEERIRKCRTVGYLHDNGVKSKIVCVLPTISLDHESPNVVVQGCDYMNIPLECVRGISVLVGADAPSIKDQKPLTVSKIKARQE